MPYLPEAFLLDGLNNPTALPMKMCTSLANSCCTKAS